MKPQNPARRHKRRSPGLMRRKHGVCKKSVHKKKSVKTFNIRKKPAYDADDRANSLETFPASESPSGSSDDYAKYRTPSEQNTQISLRNERLSRNGFTHSGSDAKNSSSSVSQDSDDDSSSDDYKTPEVSFLAKNSDGEEAEEALPDYDISSFNLSNNVTRDVFVDMQENSNPLSGRLSYSSTEEESASAVGNQQEKMPDFRVEEIGKHKPIAFSCYQTGSVALVLQHPATFNVQGKALFRVISGAVDILGYTMNPSRSDFVPIYSSHSIGILQIKTKYPDWKSTGHWKKVTKALKKFFTKKVLNLLLQSCNRDSIIVLLRKNDLSYAVDFACSYFPTVMPNHKHSMKMLGNKGFSNADTDENALIISKDQETVGEMIEQVIRSCATNEQPAPAILIYGKKAYGKSTTLRYFINRVLTNFPKVYYLDVDPGQSEFTPPGCISLVEVTKPLLGPPFTHPKSPLKMSFYGNVMIEDTSSYCASIDRLICFYKQNCSDSPLFVNTFGWIASLGKMCLDHIRSVIMPKVEVEMVSSGLGSRVFNVHSLLDEAILEQSQTLKVKICNGVAGRNDVDLIRLVASDRRDLSILSYFGRCQPYYSPVKSLNSFPPYCLRVRDVAIHTMHPVFPKFALQSINASFVALCVVDESQILVCMDDERQHKRLTPDADFSECLGFGFVRAVDLEKNILFVLTPEPFDVLKRVNTLVRGNIQMPEVIFQQQEIYATPLPYVRQLFGKKSALGQKVKRQV